MKAEAFSINILFALLGSQAFGWQPGSGNPTAADGLSVTTSSRRDTLAFYNYIYSASENYSAEMAWTGNVNTGDPGTTSAAFKDDVRRRVNFYRALAGLPGDILFDATYSSKSQEAALMMSANGQLNHSPPSTWTYYTANGAAAAGSSNLSLGNYGPGAINGQMGDDGSNNTFAGHRRWILFSRAQTMGTGDVPNNPNNSGKSGANSLWVFGPNKPVPTPKFVGWPGEGYFPDMLVPTRWSLTYPGANFAAATVTMTHLGSNVPVTVESRTDNGYGDNTIVWHANSALDSATTTDQAYAVTVSEISGGGIPTSKTYTVTLFNPDVLGESVTLTGGNTAPVSGQSFPFNAIDQADSYQLEVSKVSTSPWTEGAEDSPAPQVSASISAGYTLIQSAKVRTGTKAFQLTFPSGSFADQVFTITRIIVPGATSQLNYYDRAGYTTNTTTLSTQISTDGGATWTSLTSRSGVGINAEATWNSRSLNLGAYAGQPVTLRFVALTNNGSVYQGSDASYGFFIDDITVTNGSSLANPTVTTLAGNASSALLNATSAGGALVVGTDYTLRVRPQVGGKWFSFGSPKTVTSVASSNSYSTWAAIKETAAGLPAGTLANNPSADYDRDGRSNLLEYAFGGSPTGGIDSTSQLPAPSITATQFVIQYKVDTTLPDLIYTPQASADLQTWKAPGESGAPAGFTDSLISTNGNLQTREARIPKGANKYFLRMNVSQVP